MCEYVNLNTGKCGICNKMCGHIYFCTKVNEYKPLDSMSDECKMKDNLLLPKGYYKVVNYRKNWLYIEFKNSIIKVANPFDYVPQIVGVKETRSGQYKLTKFDKGE